MANKHTVKKIGLMRWMVSRMLEICMVSGILFLPATFWLHNETGVQIGVSEIAQSLGFVLAFASMFEAFSLFGLSTLLFSLVPKYHDIVTDPKKLTILYFIHSSVFIFAGLAGFVRELRGNSTMHNLGDSIAILVAIVTGYVSVIITSKIIPKLFGDW